MRVIVIGAGIVGLAMAYRLWRRSHTVTIIDAQPGVARGTSFANGGQLSYSYLGPLAGPGSVGLGLAGLLSRDLSYPIRVRPRLDLSQWTWAFSFLRSCTETAHDRTIVALSALAEHSRRMMAEFPASTQNGFSHSRSGKLVVYDTASGFSDATRLVDLMRTLGIGQDVLDSDECRRLEPAIAAGTRKVAGGIFTASDEAGDCHAFCECLAKALRADATDNRILLNTHVDRIDVVGSRATAIVTSAGRFEADAFVLAAGMGAVRLGAGIGLKLPIYPIKGCSLTVTAPPRNLTVSVTDAARKVVFAPLGDRLRIAGVADLDDDPKIDPRRLSSLVLAARELLGLDVDVPKSAPWAGQRPMTPSGRPIIGASPISNVFLNVGHGGLGFTLAMGAADLLAESIDRGVIDSRLQPFANAAH